MVDCKGKKILVVGLAVSGLASAKLAHNLGATVTVSDAKSESELSGFLSKLPAGIELSLGGERLNLKEFDLAVTSPGVPWDSPILGGLRLDGVEVVSEIEFASWYLEAPVIAVTGSNGKSTTVTLIGKILEKAGMKVYVGGNIGPPLADAVGGEYDWVVAEVSSFQLEGIKRFRPKISLLLNITPDHLDRHRDLHNYAGLKFRLFENQNEDDIIIVNAGDPITSKTGVVSSAPWRKFGLNEHGFDGVWIEDGSAVSKTGDEKVTLFRADDLLIPGVHNLENALAASLAGLMAGAKPDEINEAVTAFTGLEHRMEEVAVIGGISYINDSKGTNVDATIKSLAGFGKNVVVILGGSSKGADFTSLAKAVREKTKGVVLIGETAELIADALGDYSPLIRAESMKSAVVGAGELCENGDTVLLSPACASFDMYTSYKDRGAAFRNAVKELNDRSVSHAG